MSVDAIVWLAITVVVYLVGWIFGAAIAWKLNILGCRKSHDYVIAGLVGITWPAILVFGGVGFLGARLTGLLR